MVRPCTVYFEVHRLVSGNVRYQICCFGSWADLSSILVYSYAQVILDLMFWAWLLTGLGDCLRLGLGCITRWILSTRVERSGDPGLVPCASLDFCVFLMISVMKQGMFCSRVRIYVAMTSNFDVSQEAKRSLSTSKYILTKYDVSGLCYLSN